MATRTKAAFWQVVYLQLHSMEGSAGDHARFLGLGDQYIRSLCFQLNLPLKTKNVGRRPRVQFRVPVRSCDMSLVEPDSNWRFAGNLRRIREHRGYSQEQMADHLAVTVNVYQAWENVAAFPPARELVKICDLLDYRNVYKMITATIDVKTIEVMRREKMIV
jgi:DNA-binding XRE family transcriptional regulator